MKKNSMFKRLVSLALCLVFVASCLPAGLLPTASAAGATEGIITEDTVADPSTLNAWKETAFDPFDLTTEHAGGVWTDKTVVKAGDAQTVFVDKNGDPLGITAGTNNFLVALSALAANSVVTGQTALPTDTIFVLDVSGSMTTTDINAMVEAANDAIHTLLTENQGNRVGVIAYSNSATSVLPLDRYTPVTSEDNVKYIERSQGSFFSSGRLRPARITSGGRTTYVKNSDGQDMTGNGATLEGGTFIQGGLWMGLEWFQAATDTADRTPIMVLMSDGAPTWTTNDYNNVDPDDPEYGGGYTNSETDGNAFLTQLTAAYVKEKMAEEYTVGGVAAPAYFYTVGLGVSSGQGNTPSIAEAVLDTSRSRTDIENFWTRFHGLANAQNKTMQVTGLGSGGNATVTYSGELTQRYVDRYFPASDASQLSSAFQSIVNQINLTSGYIVTRLDGAGANAGGYVTFVDEIGTGMEVKNIKGILIGDVLYTGEHMAQAMMDGSFGTEDEPTILGDNLVWALKERFRLKDTATESATEIARDILEQAYAAGQIGVHNGEKNNYIAWFGNAAGEYVGFWDMNDPNAVIPADAAYANVCYGMLGTTTGSQTAHESDMMYVAIQVSKAITNPGAANRSIEARTPQTVTFRIPAALLPTITYQIALEVGSSEEITEQTPATITYNEAEPIRLVYEVGVHSQLTPENIKDFLREGYQAKDGAGNYYLYTNAWYWDGADDSDWNNNNNRPDKGDAVLYDTSKNHISYAYFEPSAQNEHYYYTEKTDLWVKTAGADTEDTSDDVYERLTTAPVTNGSVKYYFQHKTYVAKNTATETGVAVDAEVNIHYGEVSQKLLSDSNNYAQDATTGVYYIKEGTMHYHTIHEHDKLKAENNPTGSFKYRLHQLVDIAVDDQNRETHHFEIMYLGNNGRISYSPAQGFTLSKIMAEGSTATGSFTFDVILSADADGKYTETRNGVSTEKTMANKQFTVSLAAGEQVTITGIDVGATYEVKELEREGYKLDRIIAESVTARVSEATVTDTVKDNTTPAITYTNNIQQYGSLMVTKTVTYEKGSQPTSNLPEFEIVVTIPALAGKNAYVDGVPTTVGADGKITLNLADGEHALITGIPEGVAYTVTETVEDGTTNVPYGYTEEDGYTITAGTASGTIVKNETARAEVKNAYTPDDIVMTGAEQQISIDVTKNFYLYTGSNGTLDENRSFTFELLTYDTAIPNPDWVPVEVNGSAITATITFENPTSNEDRQLGTNTKTGILMSMAGVELTGVGSYYFRVAEKLPDVQFAGATYDRTLHDFVIVVTDTDLDGKLEISEVRSLQNADVTGPTDENGDGDAEHWHVSAEFNNSEITHSTKLTIEATKTLINTLTNENILKDGQFRFSLYEAAYNSGSDTLDITGKPFKTTKNGANGDIIFPTITYPFEDGSQYHYYVMMETETDGNGIIVDKTVWEIRVTVTGQSDGKAVVDGIAWREQGTNGWSGNHMLGAPANNVFKAISFENTYTAEPVEEAAIKANKTLTNLTPGATQTNMDVPVDTYKFKLEAITIGAPMPANTEVYAAADGEVDFGIIKYEKADTYEYKLTEIDTGVVGVTYDGSEYTVTVTVSDDGAGQLEVASVVYTKNGVNSATATFENTYKASPVTDVVLWGEKDLDSDPQKYDRTLNEGDFYFVLYDSGNQMIEYVANDADGEFRFSGLDFGELGTYNYSIVEYIPRNAVNNAYHGVAYDTRTIPVVIKVTDADLDGKMEVMVNETANAGKLFDIGTFENTYTATPAHATLTGHKNLIGKDLEENAFSFTITAKNGAPMPAGVTGDSLTVKNDEDGYVVFGTITYDAKGTYTYEVVEEKLDENGQPLTADPISGEYVYKGVTYSKRTLFITVEVIDNLQGVLRSRVSVSDEDGTPLTGGVMFTNTYKAASVTVNVEGDDANTSGKLFTDESSLPEDRKDMDDYAFQFCLAKLDGTVIETVEDNGVGFAFADIEYTQTGVYQYLIYEVPTGEPGVVFDQAKYRVTVTVTDDGEGALKAQVKYEKAESGESDDYETTGGILFQNSYKAKETSVSFAGKKTLTGGRVLKANDFSFILKDARSGDEIATVKNDAEGVFAFETVTYYSEGTYTYTLEEVKGNAEGITYDAAKYTLTVTVKDENGELKATTTVTKDGKAADSYGFTNIYTPKAVGTSIEVQKVLVNKSEETVGLNGFVFQLDNGTEKKTLTSGSDGKVKFDLSFDAADIGQTYTYKLSEVKGDKAHMTYDSAVYEIKVTVKQAPTGELELAVSRTGTGAFQFTNTYEPPVAEKDDPPKTGDESHIGGWTLMMAVSAVGVLAVLVLGKKKLFEQ